MTALSAGDHLLMTDSAYGPGRAFAMGTLKRMGVETTFYDPSSARESRRCSSRTPRRC